MVNNILIIYVIGFVLTYLYIHTSSYEDYGNDIPVFLTLSIFWFLIIPLKFGYKIYHYFEEKTPKQIYEDPFAHPTTHSNRNGRIYPPPYIPRRGTKFKYGK